MTDQICVLFPPILLDSMLCISVRYTASLHLSRLILAHRTMANTYTGPLDFALVNKLKSFSEPQSHGSIFHIYGMLESEPFIPFRSFFKPWIPTRQPNY